MGTLVGSDVVKTQLEEDCETVYFTDCYPRVAQSSSLSCGCSRGTSPPILARLGMCSRIVFRGWKQLINSGLTRLHVYREASTKAQARKPT
jgi:hypothetical protein